MSTALLTCAAIWHAVSSSALAGPIATAAHASGADAAERGAFEGPLEVTVHRPAAVIPSLTQAADGYLFIASETGLLRFDGHQFTRLQAGEVPGMPAGEVLRVFAVSDGGVLFSTGLGFVGAPGRSAARAEWVQRSAGLFRLARGQVTPVELPVADAEVSTWAFAEQPGQGVWIGTEQGLVLAAPDGTPKQRFTTADGLPDAFVTALAVGSDGDLWIGTGTGLAVRRAGRIEATPLRSPVLALAWNGEALFAGTAAGTFVLARDGAQLRAGPSTWVLSATRDGQVYAAENEGLARITRDGRRERLPLPSTHTAVIAMAADADGSLWLGTRAGGLAQVRPRRLWNLGSLEGLTADVPFAVLRAADGALWTTTTNAVTRIEGGRLEHHRYGFEVPGWAGRSLAQTPDGTLWIGDFDGRLIRRRRDGRFEAIALMLPPAARHLSTLFATRSGDLWLGLPDGVARVPAASISEADTALHLEPELLDRVGLCPGRVGGIVQDDAGAIWVASVEGGVGRLGPDGQGRCFTVADGVPGGPTADVTRDVHGHVWVVAAQPFTLARLVGERFVATALAAPTATAPAPPREAFGLLDDGEGHLWLTSDAGILRVSLATVEAAQPGGAPVMAQLFDVRDGMRSHECISDFSPVGASDGAGRVWFPTLLGLVGLAIQDAPARAPTRARLEHARSGGVRLPVDQPGAGPLVVGPGRTDLELGFTAPTFVAPHRLTFEYRLVGVHDWRVAGPERSVVYPVLPHGRFTFEVRARDELGRPLAEPSRHPLEVRPAWWQTRLFLFAATLTTAALALLLFRLRVRSVRARYEAVHAERGRIARDLHDSLAQGFTSIGYHLDTARALLARGPREADADVDGILGRTRSILDHCRLETRRAIWNLRAQSAGRVSLAQALARTIEEARAQSLGTVSLSVDGAAQDEPAIWEQEVPLIVQEAIANAFRHGGARRVEVALAFVPPSAGGGFRLEVRDDGAGLPTTGPRPGGFGLFSMRDRAARFGATVTLSNRPEGGAQVSVVAPAADAPLPLAPRAPGEAA